MPTHENQQSKRPRRDEDVEDSVPEATETASKADLDTEVDSLLDEIDEILEVNAEDFVKSFVQKGGQ
ncbi:MAG: ubiquitin-like protein Pup [Candidatus Nanopelagicales bacterium]|nr:ubiquitin-like protein Pup [Candidatus Nanopelagicales bacterium]